ncbi:MAG: TPR end-of-group domain-containing protein [Thermoanaerobaculia bacterium]
MRLALALTIIIAVSSAGQPADSLAAASAAYDRKDYASCGELYRRLAEHSPVGLRNQYLYNAIGCFALAGTTDDAFRALDDLIAGGYVNTKSLREEPDFDSLRADKRWEAVFARAQANWAKKFGADNRELWALREADEDDRQPGADSKAGAKRDRARLTRVKQIVAEGGLKTANDYFMAAMLFQHGSQPEDYQQARTLALRATQLDPTNTRATWLAAAAQDRYLWSIGKPQMYGTQFHEVNGVWTIEPIDDTVTDDERAKWHVPPLADARRRAESMNAKAQ